MAKDKKIADGPSMTAAEFRDALVKIMPGYSWTVHRSKIENFLAATGTQSSGMNRLLTLRVEWRERAGVPSYEAKSAGFGLNAPWLYCCKDGTLARALRGLQNHYEHMAATYAGHANALKNARHSNTKEPS